MCVCVCVYVCVCVCVCMLLLQMVGDNYIDTGIKGTKKGWVVTEKEETLKIVIVICHCYCYWCSDQNMGF